MSEVQGTMTAMAMVRKLSAGARVFTAEINRCRLGIGPDDAQVHAPMTWPRFIASAAASLTWELVRAGTLLIVSSAIAWTANTLLSAIIGTTHGDAPPVWSLLALLATAYLVVQATLATGMGFAVSRRAVTRSIVALLVVAISILAATEDWSPWIAGLTVFAAFRITARMT